MTLSEKYKLLCRDRWSGEALKDALSNYKDFKANHDNVLTALRLRHHNIRGYGEGSLSNMVFKMQYDFDKSHQRLHPFLDFEEHFQKIFPRRGILIYCELICEMEGI